MGRNKILDSYLGKVYKLAKNPRTISDGAYTKLMESLSRGNDIEFLAAKRLVLWEVPGELPDDGGERWPFAGQEGKLIVLGGNQRYNALQDMGYDRIPDEWIAVGRHKDGSWWTPEEAERFILLDNNPEGISGETDYETLVANFNETILQDVGMDFAQTPMEFQEKMAGDTEEEVEQSEHGEMDQGLTDFINRRENSRGQLTEMMDLGFYAVAVFETHEQKQAWLRFLGEQYGIYPNREIFLNGLTLSEKMGKKLEYSGLKFSEGKPIAALQEMSLDGSEEGWETNVDDQPDGEDVGDSEGDDEGAVDIAIDGDAGGKLDEEL